jgi:hypothetical protein
MSRPKIDIADHYYGYLRPIEYAGKKGIQSTWLCLCTLCGQKKVMRWSAIKIANSCGCAKKTPKMDLSGIQFGYLRAIRYVGKKHWSCQCVCGREVNVLTSSLNSGNSRSCGCRGNKPRSKPREFKAWRALLRRCNSHKDISYHNYGERGIRVCERWQKSFKNFVEDVGRAPSLAHSIDRYPNPDGHYEPGNVRWATAQEQGRNRSKRQ